MEIPLMFVFGSHYIKQWINAEKRGFFSSGRKIVDDFFDENYSIPIFGNLQISG